MVAGRIGFKFQREGTGYGRCVQGVRDLLGATRRQPYALRREHGLDRFTAPLFRRGHFMSLPRYDKSSLAMKREVVTAPGAPTPMAHYCQGVLAGETMYAAGQIASDYRTGVPTGADMGKQTRYVLNNIRSVLKAAGCDLKDVVKSQVFLTDLKDFYYFDQVWKEFFPSPPPRTTVQVSGLLVPGCRVEIDLTAVLP